ncbi:hypothetical protein CEE37_03600 [candidate division LCP-89 bacterium B3_LCP]|uniref:Acriflavin resistance protein n=1 Tax=candidate division LCP-89 bacterium B3_LCP TaxID=2012998 RepID=A0A532V368_UNCL8|nr:MAG: hypothetical protein CEE37_03600 [candidate division LCP-89 bacterium B3_LCP]
MSPIRLAVNNPVLANLLMVTLTLLGVLAFMDLPRELMPKISFNWAFIVTPYPNVPAEDVEQLVTIPIEEEIADIDGIDQITSVSREGRSFIWVKFELMSEDKFSKLLSDLKIEVDKAVIPDDVEDIYVEEFDTEDFIPIISISLSGDFPEKVMHDLAEDLEDLYLDVSGVSEIAVAGTRDREIWVEVAPEKLYAHGLTLEQVASSIKYRNFNLAGGDLKAGNEKLLVRTVGEFEKTDEIGSSVVLKSGPDGNQVYLHDVATITDGWEEEISRSRLNQLPSITLSISKKSKANSLDLIDTIKNITEEYRDKLPPGMEITYTNDNSIQIVDVLQKLQNNAILGFILVIILLWASLGWRNALITALGIPITLAITMIFLKHTGNTLNGTALFGLVLVLGMLVDDAIVVMENCYRYIQSGLPPKEAVIKGAKEVAAPVCASVFTTIAAFLPLMLLPGIMGRFMRIVPIVLSLALMASLFECFFILPSHVAEWSGIQKIAAAQSRLMERISSIYKRLLERVMRFRILIAIIMPFVILISATMIPLVGVELYRDEEISMFFVWVTMPEGTSLETTDRIITQFESEAMNLPASELFAVVATPGMMQTDDEWHLKSSVGQLIIDLKERRDRTMSIEDIMNQLRSSTADIPGVQDVQFAKVNTGPPLGKPVEVRVQGKYYKDTEPVAEILKSELAQIEGVYDVTDNYSPGKRQVKVKVDPERAAMFGLSVTQVAASIAAAFDGIVPTVFRDGDDGIDIRVKFHEDHLKEIADVTRLKFLLPDGSWVPFENVASISVEPGIADIRHFDQNRAITVSANVDEGKVSGVEVNQQLVKKFKNIEKQHPGVRMYFGGEWEEFQEAFSGILELFLIGLGLMYVILGTQFRSFIQPIIIMTAIPFAFVGSVIGLLLSGNPFSITTLFAFVALAGVVVNNSIVLVSFINDARAQGAGRHESIVQAGMLRLRPIILTSITTIFGLLPMAIGLGGRSEVWGPLANIIVWGLAFATFLTLLVIPAVYELVVDDIGGLFRRKLKMKNGWVKNHV